MHLDHLILAVNDRDASVAFFTDVLQFGCEGETGPFTVIRVSPDFTLQLAPWGTTGGQHLAFAMARAEFDAAFARVRDAGIPYGDSFHDVGNMKGPGLEEGARGAGRRCTSSTPTSTSSRSVTTTTESSCSSIADRRSTTQADRFVHAIRENVVTVEIRQYQVRFV